MIRSMAAHDALSRGRAAFDRNDWPEALRELGAADGRGELGPDDLDCLATAAYLVGEDAASADARARAHAAFLQRGDLVAAARSAFWQAFAFLDRPASRAQAGGWLARAQRVLDECGRDCAERGLLFCMLGIRKAIEGDLVSAIAAFEQADAIGTRFRDPNVLALARHGRARVLIRMNRRADGFALLDEVMIAVTAGEVTAMITGVVYCSVISACHEAFDLRRAQEWTLALAGWCAAHPQIVPFRAQCLVRRSELLQLHGAWQEAIAEAHRAAEWSARTSTAADAAAACYQQGELHRLQGDFAGADEWYRRASQAGRKPYPGLALLRLAQGHLEAAEASAERMLVETRERRPRVGVLAACIDIMLAARHVEAARRAADELSRLAGELNAPLVEAAAAYGRGVVSLAAGDPAAALPPIREALAFWQDFDAPYEIARVRAANGLACRQMGDEEGALLEFEAAQELFDQIGARPDADRVAALAASAPAIPKGPLTGREVEVLRLVAAGKSNRGIAAELAISEKTVARHLSNIFTKLDLPSRAAATAYAYEHNLL